MTQSKDNKHKNSKKSQSSRVYTEIKVCLLYSFIIQINFSINFFETKRIQHECQAALRALAALCA